MIINDNKNDNKCYEYPAMFISNHVETGKRSERIKKNRTLYR